MSASEEMESLLQQWREKTQAETEAIHAAQWPRLREIHSSKAQLKNPLDQALTSWRAQQSSEMRTGQPDAPFRQEVNRLISLEARNAQLLQSRLKKARQKKAQLEQAKGNLQKIRNSYAPKISGALDSVS